MVALYLACLNIPLVSALKALSPDHLYNDTLHGGVIITAKC